MYFIYLFGIIIIIYYYYIITTTTTTTDNTNCWVKKKNTCHKYDFVALFYNYIIFFS